MSFIEIVILLLINSISIIVALLITSKNKQENKPGIVRTIKKVHEKKKVDKIKEKKNKQLEEDLKKIEEYDGF